MYILILNYGKMKRLDQLGSLSLSLSPRFCLVNALFVSPP